MSANVVPPLLEDQPAGASDAMDNKGGTWHTTREGAARGPMRHRLLTAATDEDKTGGTGHTTSWSVFLHTVIERVISAQSCLISLTAGS